MKIKFTTCMVGGDFTRNAGDVADVPDAEAKRLIEAGFAVPVRGGKGKTEKATAEPPADTELAVDIDLAPNK